MDWEFLDMIWRFCIFSIYCSVSIYGPVWNCVAKVQDFALTYTPNFHIFHMLSDGDSRMGKVFRCSESNFGL